MYVPVDSMLDFLDVDYTFFWLQLQNSIFVFNYIRAYLIRIGLEDLELVKFVTLEEMSTAWPLKKLGVLYRD